MNPVDPILLDSLGRSDDEAYILNYRRRHLVKSDLEAEIFGIFAGINFQYNSRMINVDEVFIDPFLGESITTGISEILAESGRWLYPD